MRPDTPLAARPVTMSGSWRRGRSPPSAASLSDEDQGGARDSDRRGSDALLTRGAGMGLEVPPETRRAYSPVAETVSSQYSIRLYE